MPNSGFRICFSKYPRTCQWHKRIRASGNILIRTPISFRSLSHRMTFTSRQRGCTDWKNSSNFSKCQSELVSIKEFRPDCLAATLMIHRHESTQLVVVPDHIITIIHVRFTTFSNRLILCGNSGKATTWHHHAVLMDTEWTPWTHHGHNLDALWMHYELTC